MITNDLGYGTRRASKRRPETDRATKTQMDPASRMQESKVEGKSEQKYEKSRGDQKKQGKNAWKSSDEG